MGDIVTPYNSIGREGLILFLALIFSFCLPLGAVENPRVSLKARAFCPGEILLVVVENHHKKHPPSGKFLDKPIEFFQASSSTYLAFIGFDLDIATGVHRLQITLRDRNGVEHVWGETVYVDAKAFPIEHLTVDEGFVKLKPEAQLRVKREAEELSRIYASINRKIYWRGNFISPIPGAVSSRFGQRRVFNGVPKSPHSGADLKAKEGVPVAAAGAGRVVLAKALFYSGNTVILDHGGGLYTIYAHLSQFAVKKGQKVARGQLLGLVGATGRVTGPHLHWGIKLHGARVDPFSLLALDLDAWMN